MPRPAATRAKKARVGVGGIWGRGQSAACKASSPLALHTEGGVRSDSDVSFGASANDITGGKASGDVLQALIPFVS